MASTELVTVNEIPDVSFMADPTDGVPPLIVGFDNTSSGTDNFSWDFGNGETSIESGAVISIYETEGSFTTVLVGTSDEGCSASASTTIVVNFPDMFYEFSNIFTPNGDNSNDVFKLVFEQDVASLEIVILNRWGNVVYESFDLDFSWNGKVHNTGADCSEGVYFYKANLTNLSGDVVREHGYIHLNR